MTGKSSCITPSITPEACPGCGALLPVEDGPIHRYMTSSPACWRRYGELLAAEYNNAGLFPTHRLSVDSYAVQHPGGSSRQAIQSVGLHLARLMVQLEPSTPPRDSNVAMLDFVKRKHTLRQLERPGKFTLTIVDVAPFVGTARHVEMIQAWARSAWHDWRAHHDYIRQWVLSGEDGRVDPTSR